MTPYVTNEETEPGEMKSIDKGHSASWSDRAPCLPSQSPFHNDAIKPGACVRANTELKQ